MTAAAKRHLARFKEERTRLVRVAELGFEMAGVVDSRFFVASGDVPEAFARILARAKAHRRDGYWAAIAKARSLEECLERGDVDARFDEKKNLVDLRWDADIEPFELLGAMSGCVRDGSYFLLVDESRCFWKASFEKGALIFYGERVSKEWLPEIRAEAELVAVTLQRAGWRLDRKKMAARKRDIESYWGSALKAEIDMQTPVTILSYPRGQLGLEVQYFGKSKARWLYLELRRDVFNELRAEITFKDRLPQLLDAIVAVQSTLSPETWEPWLRAQKRKFKMSFSASGLFQEADSW